MEKYKSIGIRCYEEDKRHTFSAELAYYPLLSAKAVWEFKLWDTEEAVHAWEGNLEELAQVILAGKAALEQQKQLLVAMSES